MFSYKNYLNLYLKQIKFVVRKLGHSKLLFFLCILTFLFNNATIDLLSQIQVPYSNKQYDLSNRKKWFLTTNAGLINKFLGFESKLFAPEIFNSVHLAAGIDLPLIRISGKNSPLFYFNPYCEGSETWVYKPEKTSEFIAYFFSLGIILSEKVTTEKTRYIVEGSSLERSYKYVDLDNELLKRKSIIIDFRILPYGREWELYYFKEEDRKECKSIAISTNEKDYFIIPKYSVENVHDCSCDIGAYGRKKSSSYEMYNLGIMFNTKLNRIGPYFEINWISSPKGYGAFSFGLNFGIYYDGYIPDDVDYYFLADVTDAVDYPKIGMLIGLNLGFTF
ncbi:MAG: hypothetical protein V1779_10440 [bacterium]